MAALTDTAPETVSRVISSMRRGGMITRETGRRVRLSAQLVYVAGEMPRGMTRSRVLRTEDADPGDPICTASE
jgi:DNA-binding IclR family transcriptional regulator